MDIDVFISHSSKDVNIANAICNTLEASNIKCWIAPRDIRPGSDWAESINNAIENSKAMVLVFSENSNNSTQVAKELNLAINNNLAILPFKIDSSNPTGSMKYYLADTHWLDAISGDMKGEIENLKDVLISALPHHFAQTENTSTQAESKRTLNEKSHTEQPSTVIIDTTTFSESASASNKKKFPWKVAVAICGVAVIILALILGIGDNYDHQAENKKVSTNVTDKTNNTYSDSPTANLNEDEDILKIREMYTAVQAQLQNFTKVTRDDGIVYYYDLNFDLARIDVPANSITPYTKYYYLKDREIYFAFISDGTNENRLYFKKGCLFKHIDEAGITNVDGMAFSQWEHIVIDDLNYVMDSSVFKASNIIKYTETIAPTDEAVQSPSYYRLVNNEFGFEIKYPRHFDKYFPAYDTMAQVFSSHDNSAKIKICAGYNTGKVTPQQLCDEFIRIYSGTSDYNVVKDDWFVISLYKNEHYHYAYYKLENNVIKGFEFHFTNGENLDTYSEYIDTIYSSFSIKEPITNIKTDYANNNLMGDWYLDIDMFAEGEYKPTEQEKTAIIKKIGFNQAIITSPIYSDKIVFVSDNKAVSACSSLCETEEACTFVYTFDKNGTLLTTEGCDASDYFHSGNEHRIVYGMTADKK